MDSGIAMLSAISAGLIALIFAKAAVGKLLNFFETQGIIRVLRKPHTPLNSIPPPKS